MPITIEEEQLLDLLEESPEAVYQLSGMFRADRWSLVAGRIEAVLVAAGRTLPEGDDA